LGEGCHQIFPPQAYAKNHFVLSPRQTLGSKPPFKNQHYSRPKTCTSTFSTLRWLNTFISGHKKKSAKCAQLIFHNAG
jgi:hypothetical protein